MERLREARRAKGWSQARLAAEAGVSRQLVSATEAGRHEPGVTAAVALARALGTDVEALFAPRLRPLVTPDGAEVPDGPVALAQVGATTVGVPVRPADLLAGHPVDGLLRDGELRATGRPAQRLLALGCDPALGLLAALAPPEGPVLWVRRPSAAAAAALAAGRAHLAVVHGSPGAIATPPAGARALRLGRVRVGLAHARRGRLTPARLGRCRVVQRPAAAAAQAAFERWLQREGIPTPVGPRVGDHLSAARLVAQGAAVAAVSSETAAAVCGLGFEPIEEHELQIWVRTDLPAAGGTEVLALLEAPAFGDRLRSLPGYEAVAS